MTHPWSVPVLQRSVFAQFLRWGIFTTTTAFILSLPGVFLGGGEITKDTYDKKHQELQDQMQLLEIEMSEHSKADYEYQNTVATVISGARGATIFDNSSEPARKRQFLNYILQNPTVKEKSYILQ